MLSIGGAVAASTLASRAAPVRVKVDAAAPRWTISKYLTGMHFVYAFEADDLYQDERIADWMRRSRVGLIRWPGGTAVQNYHWDALNGIAFRADTWDPAYHGVARNPRDYMDLDEYIAYCRRVGAEPMVGINIKSGKRFHREADARDEARRLIQYCRRKHYGVKFWYIGNECYKGFDVSSYLHYIDEYAQLLKSIDPGIRVIADWTFGPAGRHRFNQTLEIARNARGLDIMEIHEKWANPWGLASGHTFEDWQHEIPLYDGRLGRYIQRFHEAMRAVGKPDLKLAFNEWGLGRIEGADAFGHALVAADFLIELCRHRVYQACFWNLNMGSAESRILITKDRKHTLVGFGPAASVFEMFGQFLGKDLLPLTTTRSSVYGLAARDGETGAVQVLLLNKNDVGVSIQLDVLHAGYHQATLSIESLLAPGKVVESPAVPYSFSSPAALKLAPWSLNRAVFRAREPLSSGNASIAQERGSRRGSKKKRSSVVAPRQQEAGKDWRQGPRHIVRSLSPGGAARGQANPVVWSGRARNLAGLQSPDLEA